jgi:hypothetical protein
MTTPKTKTKTTDEMTDGKEVRTMHGLGLYQLYVANELHAEDRRQARLAAHAREARALQRQRGWSLRRSLGRSLIGLGERIAAEPALRPVRSP